MTIYTSEKVMPYVYMCIHKQTGQFYVGYRSSKRQTVPSHADLPSYRTSSKLVNPVFEQFDWVILAEFFDPISAYIHEQNLIHENWDNPLILNRTCHYDNKNYFINSCLGKPRSEATKRKLSVAHTGSKRPPRSDETKKKMSESRRKRTVEYKHSPGTRQKLQAVYDARRGQKQSDETRHKKSIAGKGRKHSDVSKQKMSASKRGKLAHNKGKPMSDVQKQKLREARARYLERKQQQP